MKPMKQLSLAETGFLPKAGKQTRKAVFLAEMETVVPWSRLAALIEPFYPKKRNGRPPMPLGTMLRIHFMQQWFGYSDPAMEEALHDVPLLRQFAGLDAFEDVMPDESTILRFRHLLEKHDLAVAIFAEVNAVLSEKGLSMKRGTVVDATLIAAPSSTKNEEKKRDPEMTQTKKGNQWHFGIKAHIGVDADSGLIHTVECTTAKVPMTIARATHRLAIYRQGATDRRDQTGYPTPECFLERLGIHDAKHPIEGIVRRNAVLQLKEAFQPSFFLGRPEGDIFKCIDIRKRGADGNHQHLLKIIFMRIARPSRVGNFVQIAHQRHRCTRFHFRRPKNESGRVSETVYKIGA